MDSKRKRKLGSLATPEPAPAPKSLASGLSSSALQDFEKDLRTCLQQVSWNDQNYLFDKKEAALILQQKPDFKQFLEAILHYGAIPKLRYYAKFLSPHSKITLLSMIAETIDTRVRKGAPENLPSIERLLNDPVTGAEFMSLSPLEYKQILPRVIPSGFNPSATRQYVMLLNLFRDNPAGFKRAFMRLHWFPFHHPPIGLRDINLADPRLFTLYAEILALAKKEGKDSWQDLYYDSRQRGYLLSQQMKLPSLVNLVEIWNAEGEKALESLKTQLKTQLADQLPSEVSIADVLDACAKLKVPTESPGPEWWDVKNNCIRVGNWFNYPCLTENFSTERIQSPESVYFKEVVLPSLGLDKD